MRLPKFEHLYVIFAPFSMPGRSKIGISIEAKQRKIEIERELRACFGYGVRVYAIGLPVLYARQIEARLHRAFYRMRYNGVQHTNGGSEWFWSINVLTCLLLVFLRLWMPQKYFLLPWIVLMIPIPLDFLLLTLLIFAIQWAAILGGIWAAMWALNLY